MARIAAYSSATGSSSPQSLQKRARLVWPLVRHAGHTRVVVSRATSTSSAVTIPVGTAMIA